jgi:hypothetical protein
MTRNVKLSLVVLVLAVLGVWLWHKHTAEPTTLPKITYTAVEYPNAAAKNCVDIGYMTLDEFMYVDDVRTCKRSHDYRIDRALEAGDIIPKRGVPLSEARALRAETMASIGLTPWYVRGGRCEAQW